MLFPNAIKTTYKMYEKFICINNSQNYDVGKHNIISLDLF